MSKFRKKPVVIEAKQAAGTPESNREIIDWTRGSATPASMDDHPERGKCLSISTLEGAHWVSPGDWIIKGVAGEFYPCKPDIFAATYEAATTAFPIIDPGPDSLEREIQAKANAAPRVTPADIEAEIASEHYFTAGEGVIGAFAVGEFDSRSSDVVILRRGIASTEVLKPSLNLLTFCVLVLRNGFTVTGESACASTENFDAEVGRRIARENAVSKVWPLLKPAVK